MDIEKFFKDVGGGFLGLMFQAQAQVVDPDIKLKNCAREVIRQDAPKGTETFIERNAIHGDYFAFRTKDLNADRKEIGSIGIEGGDGGPASLSILTMIYERSGRGDKAVSTVYEGDKRNLGKPLVTDGSINFSDILGVPDADLVAHNKTTTAKLYQDLRKCMRQDLIG